MKKILFVPITFNLATTGKALAIAEAIRDDFDCHFASYGGAFEPLIEERGFPLTRLEPRFSPERIRRMYAIDQARRIGTSHSRGFVRRMAQGELELYRSLSPAAVVTGMNPSLCISSSLAGIPLVWAIQSGVAMNTAARLGKLRDMGPLGVAPLHFLSPAARTNLSETMLNLVFSTAARPFNQVAAEYGLEPFRNIEDLFRRGYHLLFAEPPGFSEIPLPSHARFIGPLITRLNTPLPAEILHMPKDKPVVYFAMGSSGRADVVARILAGFAGKPYRVIAPVKNLLGDRRIPIPDNVFVTGWLPALQANRMADISVIHGGIGTVMTACLAGKPAVGVAMSPEQSINLQNLSAKGFAVHIPGADFTLEYLFRSIERLLADPAARRKALEYRAVIEEWDTPIHARNFFRQTFA